MLAASALAKPHGSLEGVIERAAVDALVAQFRTAGTVRLEQGSLTFAVSIGGRPPAVEKSLEPRGPGRRAGAGARARMQGAVVRQRAFWRKIRLGGIEQRAGHGHL